MPNGNQNEEYQQLLAYLQDIATGMVQNGGGDYILFLTNYALAIQTLAVELLAGNIETIPAIQALEQAVNQFLSDTVPGYSGPPGAVAPPGVGPAPGPEPITPPPPPTDPLQSVPPPASGATCAAWYDWIDRYMSQVPTPAWPLPIGGSRLPPVGQAKCVHWKLEGSEFDAVCVVSEWEDGTGASEIVLYRFLGFDRPIVVDPLHRYHERLQSLAVGGGLGAWVNWLWKQEPAGMRCAGVAPPSPVPIPRPPPPPLIIPEPEPEPGPPAEPCPEPPLVECLPEPVFEPVAPISCCPPVDIFVPGFLHTLPIDQQRSILRFYGLEHLAGLTAREIEQRLKEPAYQFSSKPTFPFIEAG